MEISFYDTKKSIKNKQKVDIVTFFSTFVSDQVLTFLLFA